MGWEGTRGGTKVTLEEGGSCRIPDPLEPIVPREHKKTTYSKGSRAGSVFVDISNDPNTRRR